MRYSILIAALACQIAVGADPAAARPESNYADALHELEQEIGSGVHGATENVKTKIHQQRGAHRERMEEMAGFKKKVGQRRVERERRSMDDIKKPDGPLQRFKNKSNDHPQQKMHQRQKEKRIQLDEMHRKVSDKLAAHHEGRELLSDEDVEHHTRRKAALERKKTSWRDEKPEQVSCNNIEYLSFSSCIFND